MSIKISVSPNDLNADWLKQLVNSETGKTYREEELALHESLGASSNEKPFMPFGGKNVTRRRTGKRILR